MTNLRNRKKLMRALQYLCVFFVGIIFNHLFSEYRCEVQFHDEIDENNYLLVALVLTAPNNFDRRNAMRETWLSLRPWQMNESFYQNEVIYIPAEQQQNNGFLTHESVEQQQSSLKNYQKWLLTKHRGSNVKVPNLKIKTLFAIGMRDLNDETTKRIRAESDVYSDLLLLEDLKDSYKNLTLKLLQSLEKVNNVTPNFKYLLKCDDDSYVKLDYLSVDLLEYAKKLKAARAEKSIELYWGFFNGRANIKKSGQWKEVNYDLCDRYLPYALGGGYVISKNLVTYLGNHSRVLNRYESEDISMGTWLSSFNNIHRRHDPRFDTTYIPRKCKNYHMVMHKRTVTDMREIHMGKQCFSEVKYDESKKPVEYFYDWTQSPSKCCDNKI
jgi:galactosylxylosylprotein 3-beta-galactosyltransferase